MRRGFRVDRSRFFFYEAKKRPPFCFAVELFYFTAANRCVRCVYISRLVCSNVNVQDRKGVSITAAARCTTGCLGLQCEGH